MTLAYFGASLQIHSARRFGPELVGKLLTSAALLLVLAVAGGCKSKGGGSTTEGENHTVSTTPPGVVKAGQEAVALVQVVPKNGYKINKEYPTRLTVSGPAASSPAKLELRAKQAARLTEAELSFRPASKLTAAGRHPFTGTIKFSVCTDEICTFHEESVKWEAQAN